MPNEYVNHVVINGVTKLDLRADTITASSLAQGITAHDASGAPITGTASGGGGSVTQDSQGYIVIPSTGGGGGGGASNLVQGTFKYGSEYAGTAQTVNVAYSGSGYPIAVVVNTTDTNFTSLVMNYAIHSLSIVKREWNTAPTYTEATDANRALQSRRFKSSTSDSTAYSSGHTDPYTAYSTSAATDGNTLSLRVTSDTTLSVYIHGASAYGFAPDIEYTYYVVYSS